MKPIRDYRQPKVMGGLASVGAVCVMGIGLTSGLAEATSQITYVGRVTSARVSGPSSSASMIVSRDVTAGDALVVGIMLKGSSTLSGPVIVFDNAGNVYAADADQNDAEGGNRILILSARRVRALPSGGTMTVTFPRSAECQITIDEFAGVVGVESKASSHGAGEAFESGSISTSERSQLVVGMVGSQQGSGARWSTGWMILPSVVDSQLISTAYRVSHNPGSLGASGAVAGRWLAATVAYVPEMATDRPAETAQSDQTIDQAAATEPPPGWAPSTHNSGPITTAATSKVAVYVGYYDTHHTASIKSKPSPWKGSSGVVFVGRSDSGGGWDTSAIRIDNLTSGSLSGVVVSVDIGSHHYALWGSNTIPAGGKLILAQTSPDSFDGSDTNRAGCYDCSGSLCKSAVSKTIPVVHVTAGGSTTNYSDTGQILNTHGVDSAGCPYTGTRKDESETWQRLSG